VGGCGGGDAVVALDNSGGGGGGSGGFLRAQKRQRSSSDLMASLYVSLDCCLIRQTDYVVCDNVPIYGDDGGRMITWAGTRPAPTMIKHRSILIV
jgi:hypothetical protein